jgi:FkbM family methyltransferase
MKKIIFKICCNKISGKLITLIFKFKIPNIRLNFKRYNTSHKYSNDIVRAMIFFGFYESAECRLLKKYFPKNKNVIELGASMGIVSSIILDSIQANCKAILLEANPFLISTIESNVESFKNKDFSIINKAICYSGNTTVDLCISSNNTEVSLNCNTTSSKFYTSVSACKLRDISLTNDNYTLVCDIEGAEIDMLKYDIEALDNCTNMFIELHVTKSNGVIYSIPKMVKMIEKLKFNLVERDGNVFYFSKEINVDE